MTDDEYKPVRDYVYRDEVWWKVDVFHLDEVRTAYGRTVTECSDNARGMRMGMEAEHRRASEETK